MHPEDLPPLGQVVVPDDARALERDVVAYHREQRAARRQARYRRLIPRRRSRTPRGVAAVAIVTALVLSTLAGLVAVLGPGLGRGAFPRSGEPLASPTIGPGHLGGLLPAVTLTSVAGSDRAATVAARGLRPAALVLVPAGCACATEVEDVLAVADEARLAGVVVGPRGSDAAVATLADPDPEVGAATGMALIDTSGGLLSAFQVTTMPVLIAVDPAGIVQRTVAPLTDSVDSGTAVRAVLGTLADER